MTVYCICRGFFQDTSYVGRPSCFSGLVHKGRQLCSLLSTSCQSSGWFACPNIRLNCTCDSFSRFTETPGQLMCPAGKATYSPFHSIWQRYFKCSSSMLWTLMAAIHDLQRTVSTLCQSFPNLKESMYNDQRMVSAKGSSICCMHNRYWESQIVRGFFQDTSYVCRPGCFSGLVHKGRQLCSLLSTSCQSSGWFACPNIRLKCTCDSFSRFTKSQDSWCALQARLRIRPFILSCRNTL